MLHLLKRLINRQNSDMLTNFSIKKLVQLPKVAAIQNKCFVKKLSRTLSTYRHPSYTVSEETDNEIVLRYAKIFDDCNIDGWWVRKHMSDLSGMDMIPHPLIIQAALRACRRLNDYALAIRFLEVVKFKCGSQENKIYPWIINQIAIVFDELGMEGPDDICFYEPELFLDDSTDPEFMGPPPAPPGKGSSSSPPSTIGKQGDSPCVQDLALPDLSRKLPPPCQTDKNKKDDSKPDCPKKISP